MIKAKIKSLQKMHQNLRQEVIRSVKIPSQARYISSFIEFIYREPRPLSATFKKVANIFVRAQGLTQKQLDQFDIVVQWSKKKVTELGGPLQASLEATAIIMRFNNEMGYSTRSLYKLKKTQNTSHKLDDLSHGEIISLARPLKDAFCVREQTLRLFVQEHRRVLLEEMLNDTCGDKEGFSLMRALNSDSFLKDTQLAALDSLIQEGTSAPKAKP